MNQYKSYYKSPIGMILLESDGKNLTALQIEGQQDYKEKESLKIKKENLLVFQKSKEMVRGLLR